MRLEELNNENVQLLPDNELKSLKEVAAQLYRTNVRWTKQIAEQMIGINQPIERSQLIQAAEILSEEVQRRGLSTKQTELDTKMLRKRLRGADVAELPMILVKSSVVCLSGRFVTNPKEADSVEVRIDADEFDDTFSMELEKRMIEGFMGQTGLAIAVQRDAENLTPPIIPVYDLVLMPRTETTDENNTDKLVKRLEERNRRWAEMNRGLAEQGPLQATGMAATEDRVWLEQTEGPEITYISKPYPNEHAARQLAPNFPSYRRKNNAFGTAGIHAIYGIKGGKSKVQSIRFSASKFTVAQAKAWLKEHGYKTSVEAASGKVKKVESTFLKSEEARIVGGIIYSVGTDPDSQGDFVDSAEELFEAMKSWMVAGHPMRFMHNGKRVSTPLIECFQATDDTMKNGELVKAGSWYISNYIPEEYEELWQAIKGGEISGYSMAGTATSQAVGDTDGADAEEA